jgi:hypothetical protein
MPPPLLVPRWSQTDPSDSPWAHVIAVFFVSLDVASKLEPDMFVVVKMRHAVSVRKSIEPKHGVADESNDHETRNLFKQK